ncbi:MAG: hypothetical protein H6888_14885 [Nitratireductor sp.]|nr:hypothetical protein [Nitratireductor sp.]MCC0022349.1 hypothetical protein [Nitratireductor sp.]
MTKRSWIIGGVVVALLGTSAFAAKTRFDSPDARANFATERVTQRLGLNEEQKAAFKDMATEFSGMRLSSAEFLVDLKSKLKELTADNTLTEEEANQLRDQITAEFERRADQLIPDLVKFYNLLDDNQKGEVMARLYSVGDRSWGHDDHRWRGHGDRDWRKGNGRDDYRGGGNPPRMAPPQPPQQ